MRRLILTLVAVSGLFLMQDVTAQRVKTSENAQIHLAGTIQVSSNTAKTKVKTATVTTSTPVTTSINPKAKEKTTAFGTKHEIKNTEAILAACKLKAEKNPDNTKLLQTIENLEKELQSK
jgi:hypothetical protein